MILRKPYAFLIKNFRIIHFILSGLLIFIAYNTSRIYTFFKNYIKDSSYLRIYIEPSITSIPWYIYITLLLSIGIFIAIFVLMNKKKKPTKFYFISIIFYTLLIVVFLLSSSQLFSLLQDQANLKFVTLTRDLIRIFSYLQYIFIVIAFLRAIGFNIKKFDFKNDLKEMNISEEDSEEFEVEVEIDANDIKTKLRRTLRILKYIANENKKLLIVLGTGISLYLIVSLVLNIFVYNRVYRQNETFRIGDLQFKVLNSYESTKAYNLKDISSNNKYIYYVVSTEIKNKGPQAKKLNLDNIRLKVSKYKSYETDKKYYSSFMDIGIGYYEQNLEANSTNNYIFVFKVDKEYEKEAKTFEILKNITISNGETIYNYSKVKIKPKNTDESKVEKQASLNEKMNITDNVLGNIYLTIESIDFVDNVEYQYKEKINDKEYTFTSVLLPRYDDYYGKKILKMKATVESDKVINQNAIKAFIGNFGHIRYLKNGKESSNPFILTELTSSDNQYKYIDIYEKAIDADNIWLDIIIRNKKYVYKLK